MGTQLPFPKRQIPPVFSLCLLWPNGWMDQDATWYGGMPQCRPHCGRWRPSSSSKKGAQPPPPIFSPCLLWPNGWMDQDATSYEDRPRPKPHCVTWGLGHISSPEGAQPPIFGRCLLRPNGHPPLLLLNTCSTLFDFVWFSVSSTRFVFLSIFVFTHHCSGKVSYCVKTLRWTDGVDMLIRKLLHILRVWMSGVKWLLSPAKPPSWFIVDLNCVFKRDVILWFICWYCSFASLHELLNYWTIELLVKLETV